MSDMLSQEEIDALLSGDQTEQQPEAKSENISEENQGTAGESIDFSEESKDTIGEIGNISMGTAATTLSTLLNEKVVITTPQVSIISLKELSEEYPLPFVGVEVRYKDGIKGTNLLVLREDDVKTITKLMMGQPVEPDEEPVSDLHLSAIAEAMNQMVGSASTSLSEMFMKKIDIFPPKAFKLDLQTPDIDEYFSDLDESFVRISFKMQVGDLIDSSIMQLIPVDFAKEMVDTLMPESGAQEAEETKQPEKEQSSHAEMPQEPASAHGEGVQSTSAQTENFSLDFDEQPSQRSQSQAQQNVNVQPAQFQSFDEEAGTGGRGVPENISLIQDVPLKVTVELGRTVKRVNEVLEFGPGTIVELDKIVGEPLDILVNGQYVAKGEVVVIDENYGIRVTDIVSPNKRFSKI